MLQEHSAILSNCIKLSSVFKSFILFIFEWLLKISFTVKHKIVMLRNLLTFSLKGESVSLKSVSMKRQYRLNIKKCYVAHSTYLQLLFSVEKGEI